MDGGGCCENAGRINGECLRGDFEFGDDGAKDDLAGGRSVAWEEDSFCSVAFTGFRPLSC